MKLTFGQQSVKALLVDACCELFFVSISDPVDVVRLTSSVCLS